MKHMHISSQFETSTETVSDYVERQIFDHDTRGAAESAESNAEKAQKSLASLCQILADKGVLDANDIVSIAGSSEWGVEFELVNHE